MGHVANKRSYPRVASSGEHRVDTKGPEFAEMRTDERHINEKNSDNKALNFAKKSGYFCHLLYALRLFRHFDTQATKSADTVPAHQFQDFIDAVILYICPSGVLSVLNRVIRYRLDGLEMAVSKAGRLLVAAERDICVEA